MPQLELNQQKDTGKTLSESAASRIGSKQAWLEISALLANPDGESSVVTEEQLTMWRKIVSLLENDVESGDLCRRELTELQTIEKVLADLQQTEPVEEWAERLFLLHNYLFWDIHGNSTSFPNKTSLGYELRHGFSEVPGNPDVVEGETRQYSGTGEWADFLEGRGY